MIGDCKKRFYESKIDYEELKKKAIEQWRYGKSLFGKDGAFAPLLKEILEALLEGEMEGHLDEEERATGFRKNGKKSQKLKTADGMIDLETPGTGLLLSSLSSSRSERQSWLIALKAGSSVRTVTA